MPPSEVGLLDRLAERGARRLAERTTTRSRLGRVGGKLLTTLAPPLPRAAPDEPVVAITEPPRHAVALAPDAITPVKPPAADMASPPAKPEPPAAVAEPEPVPAPPAADLAPSPAEPAPTKPALAAEPEPVLVPAAPVAEALPLAQPAPTAPPAAHADPEPEPAVPVASTPAPEPGAVVVIGDRSIAIPDDPVAATVAISQARFEAGSKPTVVLARADALTLAVAAPLAAALDAPLLAVDGTLALSTAGELGRLGATRRIAVGLDLPDTEPIGPADDLPTLSVEVAALVRKHAGTVRAFAVADTKLAGAVAAAGALRKFPVMVGAAAAGRGSVEGEHRAAVTYLVGAEMITAAADVPGGFPLPAPTPQASAARLHQLLRADGVLADNHTLATTTDATPAAVTAAMAAAGGPVLFA